jgi:TonB family protein
MRKNSIFLSMIGLSVVLHGLALIGIPGNGFSAQPSVQEIQFVQTLKMIKVGTTPQKIAPGTPIEQKSIEKIVESPPEVPSIEKTEEAVESEETTPREVVPEDGDSEKGDSGHDEEAQEDGEGWATEGAPTGGTMTDREDTEGREYEALLGYVKDFIDKNLVYPPMARRRNMEGVVGVHFEIERDGGLAAVTVDQPSGSSILDNAAVSLVKKMHPPENLTLNRTLALRVNIEYKLTE